MYATLYVVVAVKLGAQYYEFQVNKQGDIISMSEEYLVDFDQDVKAWSKLPGVHVEGTCYYDGCSRQVNSPYDEAYCLFHALKDKKGIPGEQFNEIIRREFIEKESYNFKGFIFPAGIDFSEWTNKFDEVVDFQEAHFEGLFKDCEYHDFCAVFKGITFKKEVLFSNVIFSGAVDFSETYFDSLTNFSGSQFVSGSQFWGSRFTGFVNFYKAQFKRVANFCHVQFSGKADFKSAQFDEVYFVNACFDSTANFKEVQFGSAAGFAETRFCGEVDFSEVQFNEIALFSKTHFYGSLVSFCNNTIKANVLYFDKVLFSPNVKFCFRNPFLPTILRIKMK